MASMSGSQQSGKSIHATAVHNSGSDTISLGSGSDTVFEQGQASVHGLFGGGASVANAATGAATLLGGSSSREFVTALTKNTMQGGLRTSTDALPHESLAGGSSSHVFDFTKETGQHVISNFVVGQDKLYLEGASFSQLQQNHEISTVGGNTIIKLAGGHTSIELKGITDLSKNDFTHKH